MLCTLLGILYIASTIIRVLCVVSIHHSNDRPIPARPISLDVLSGLLAVHVKYPSCSCVKENFIVPAPSRRTVTRLLSAAITAFETGRHPRGKGRLCKSALPRLCRWEEGKRRSDSILVPQRDLILLRRVQTLLARRDAPSPWTISPGQPHPHLAPFPDRSTAHQMSIIMPS